MTQGNIQLRVSDFIYAIRKRKFLILFMAIAGLVFGFLFAGATYLQGTMTRNFEIHESVVITTEAKGGTFISKENYPNYDDFRMAAALSDTVSYILKSESTMQEVIDETGLVGISPKDISGNLKISVYNETPVLEISLTWRNAEEGIAILEALSSSATGIIRNELKTGRVTVIDPPAAKYIIGSRMKVPTWGIMAVLGFAAGIFLAVLDVLVRPTLINLKDVPVALGLETLCTVPAVDRELPSPVNAQGTEVMQAYSAAAYILRNRLGGDGKKIYVTSSDHGEGRTTAAAYLATALSHMEKRVLLVDFDTANPQLGTLMLGEVDYAKSLNALFRGETDEAHAINHVNGFIDVLPTVLEHNPVPVDNTVMDCVDRISKDYDYVIMDTSPAGRVSETLSLNRIADAALFVAGFDMVQMYAIRETVEKLDKSGIRIPGCIVNADKTPESLDILGKVQKRRKKGRKKADEAVLEDAGENLEEMMAFNGRGKPEEKASPKKEAPSGGNILDAIGNARDEERLTDEDAARALFEIGLKGGSDDFV